MMRFVSAITMLVIVTVLVIPFTGAAWAEEVKMLGNITKIEMGADGKAATVTLKDAKTGQDVVIQVSDEDTLEKFKDRRIGEGDEIRCTFEKEGGKNSSKTFRKTAGC